MSCSSYWITKVKRSTINAAKLQLIASLIPSIIKASKNLHVDTARKLKEILIKFLRATIYIAWAASTPFIILCIASKLGFIYGGNTVLEQLAYSIGQMGILFEPVAKMNQYVGFYVPKAVDAWVRLILKVNWLHNWKGKSLLIVMAMCGFIGIAHSRGHYDKCKKI